MAPDLVLLHAPSVYDFRQKTILQGPVSDHIPSSPVFEMYPIGFASMAEYLARAGYQTRIVNLAVRMLKDKDFNAEAFIKQLDAPVFGIDLHWSVHAHGAIEVARIVKRHHPRAKVVFGGLSSSYFYKELIGYPEIDYVLRGDSTEEPLRQLMAAITTGREPETVPNLVWRDSQHTARENAFTHVPTDLSDVMLGHYANTVRSVIKYRDLASYTPFSNWKDYPITAVLTCKGCTQNCVICGGSAATFRQFYNRDRAVFRSPEAVVQDIKQIERFSNGPIFILGDLCQPGEEYAYELLRQLQKIGVRNQFILELFTPASRDVLRQMGQACPDFCMEISPESHDPEVRRASGRSYSNEELEQTLRDTLDSGCSRLDLFFMIGLPKQTPASVMATIDYCEHLLQKFGGDKRLFPFIAPIAPFLDPGSLGFEQPQRHGYQVQFRTLEEHRQALLAPSWKNSLNYETDWLTRHQIADVAYEAIRRINNLKAKYGIIPQPLAEVGEQRIQVAQEMMHRLDDILDRGDQEALAQLKPLVDKINCTPVSEKIELALPVGRVKLKTWRSLWSAVTARK